MHHLVDYIVASHQQAASHKAAASQKQRASQAQQNCECNYPDNYYGDQTCMRKNA